MNNFGNLVSVLLLWMVFSTHAESHYYRRSYYSPISTPPTRYHSSSNSGFVPMTYSGDLFSAESKRKDSSSKSYSKKIPYRTIDSDEDDSSNERFTSDEYSNEAHAYNSKESDSREFTIGTQIRVQHPITVPKKATSSHPKHSKYISHSSPSQSSYKATSYSDLNLSAESPEPPPPKKHHSPKYTQLYEPDPFHLVPPPKTTAATKGAVGYDVYETDQEDYEPAPPSSRTKSLLRDRFKGVASKKQIEKYLEDQQKMLDEALKLQLLNDPKFEQYLKLKEKERIESEHFELETPASSNGPPSSFRSNFNENLPPHFKGNRSHRRPQSAELKRPPKGKQPKRRFRSALVFNV